MKKTSFFLLLTLCLFQVFYTASAMAQSPAEDTITFDETFVTATRTKRNLTEIPARASILSAAEIASSPAQQVDDILRFVPGINVNRSAGIYSMRPMVTLRGLSGDEQSQTLVLMNGVPINTSDEGGVNWNRINYFDIEKIEVFKGPGSSLYGNNAMGGVINIITKKPSKPQEITGGVSYGTFNTVRQDLGLRIRTSKDFYAVISEFYQQSDGYMNVLPEKKTPYDTERPLEAIGLSARAGMDRNPWLKWEVQYDVFRDKRGEGYQVYTPDGVYRNFNTNLFRGMLQGGDGKFHYDASVFYQLEHYYDVNEGFRGTNYFRYDVDAYREESGGLLNFSHELGTFNTLAGGIEYKTGSISGGDYYQTSPYDTVTNKGKITTMAVYAQDELGLLNNKIRLVAGLRFDQVRFSEGEYYTTTPWEESPELNNHTWTSLSPRLGVRFNFIREVSAYISYAKGFRASILDDLTRTGWMWVGPKYANPELGPEYMHNYELGLDIFPSGNMKISASAYLAKGKDFLYYVATGDTLYGTRPVYRRENVTNVTMKGVEVEFNYPVLTKLSLSAGYTYSESKIDAFDERPDLENKYLKYAPKHKASAAVKWNGQPLHISLMTLYKSAQYANDENTKEIDPYFTFDLQLSKQMFNYLNLALDIQDVFDNRHMETMEYISPGRLITLRFSFAF